MGVVLRFLPWDLGSYGSYIRMGRFVLKNRDVSHSYSICGQTAELTDPTKESFPFLNPSLPIFVASPPRREYHPVLSPGRSDVKRWLSSI